MIHISRVGPPEIRIHDPYPCAWRLGREAKRAVILPSLEVIKCAPWGIAIDCDI